MNDSSADIVTPGDDFLNRVRRAGATVLRDSETGRQVRSLCDDHARARRLITQDRAAGALVLAVPAGLETGAN